MSIIEHAIARMRNQGAATKPVPQEPVRVRPTAVEAIPDLLDLPTASKQMVVNVAELRARGYLPEESESRQFVEQYRRIKRPLIDKAVAVAAHGQPRVIMVTSALPGDGKTFTSVNLALSMALERDISVLLVDCDVIKRHVSQIFGLKSEAGLLDALVEESIDVESLVVQTDQRGLSILPAGTRTDITAELLSSNRMRQILAHLRARDSRRILLLDSPPLLITNEGQAMLNMTDQVVLVVRAGHTPRHALEEACSLLGEQRAGGIILNDVPTAASNDYYNYNTYDGGATETNVDAP